MLPESVHLTGPADATHNVVSIEWIVVGIVAWPAVLLTVILILDVIQRYIPRHSGWNLRPPAIVHHHFRRLDRITSLRLGAVRLDRSDRAA